MKHGRTILRLLNKELIQYIQQKAYCSEGSDDACFVKVNENEQSYKTLGFWSRSFLRFKWCSRHKKYEMRICVFSWGVIELGFKWNSQPHRIVLFSKQLAKTCDDFPEGSLTVLFVSSHNTERFLFVSLKTSRGSRGTRRDSVGGVLVLKQSMEEL